MTNKLNWGIIGPGRIATKFAEDLRLSSNSALYGVASRNGQRAKQFCKEHHGFKGYDSYEDLIQDPNLDVIYIATPHSFHYEQTVQCLKSGKAVLCEKPLGIDLNEVNALMDESRKQNTFLMEAMWTRFIPATEKLIEVIHNNSIGKIQTVYADFGFKGDLNPDLRLANKSLGGGSLLDIGIYPVYLSLLTLGTPESIKASATFTGTHVDSDCNMEFMYKNGAHAFLKSSFLQNTPTEARIIGENGEIKLHSPFHHTTSMTITTDMGKETIQLPYDHHGYLFEILEVESCMKNGLIESTKHSHEMSRSLSYLLEQVKKEIGLTYVSRMK